MDWNANGVDPGIIDIWELRSTSFLYLEGVEDVNDLNDLNVIPCTTEGRFLVALPMGELISELDKVSSEAGRMATGQLRQTLVPDRRIRSRRWCHDFDRPLVMGVLNVTPDSFSDGGHFMDHKRALGHALDMIDEGADIIDVGGESTRPGAEPVSIKDEIERVAPLVGALSQITDVTISVDTMKPYVARAALDAGAHLINDVSGLRNEDMIALLAETGCAAVAMHMHGEPRTMQSTYDYDDVVANIGINFDKLIARVETQGVGHEQLLLDPGIGFGKSVSHNLQLLDRLNEFSAFGRPLVIGASRKSFIGRILDVDVEHRLEGSLAVATAAVIRGADVIRVHDVAETVGSVRMVRSILNSA